MSIPQPPIEAENYARGLDVIITEAEHQVINEVQATIDVLMRSLEAEAEGEISDERLEQLTAALNRQLETCWPAPSSHCRPPFRGMR